MRAPLVLLICACAASASECGTFSTDARAPLHTAAPYFASWNIDSSTDREFFMVDWTSAALVSAAKGLAATGGTHIRFGGTGNNFLHYETPSSPCPTSGEATCLNSTTWQGITALSIAAKSPLIFGVNFFPNGKSNNKTFDPSNAVDFFKGAHARGDTIWGVENGNEINLLVTAEEQAAGLLALDDALATVYGTDARPLLIGPDALGLHVPAPPLYDYLPSEVILQYMADFVVAMEGRLHAVTHHEYVEINITNVIVPAFLDTTYEIAVQVVAKIRNVSSLVEIWAGEIGPHNGDGGPGDGRLGNCSGNLICGRWGSSLWYADAMASKARAGYAAFCRQDFLGADVRMLRGHRPCANHPHPSNAHAPRTYRTQYGLVNFTTFAPATDYWVLVLWQKLVGTRVLNVTSSPADLRVRVYAFCATSNMNATLVIVNLSSDPLCLAPPGIADIPQPRLEFSLTPADGTLTSANAMLNGVILNLDASGNLPALTGTAVPFSSPINLAPLSVTFVNFETSADACGN